MPLKLWESLTTLARVNNKYASKIPFNLKLSTLKLFPAEQKFNPANSGTTGVKKVKIPEATINRLIQLHESIFSDVKRLVKYRKITIIPPKKIKPNAKKNQLDKTTASLTPIITEVKINTKDITNGCLAFRININLTTWEITINFNITAPDSSTTTLLRLISWESDGQYVLRKNLLPKIEVLSSTFYINKEVS